jgi:hypothetical protein
MTDTKAPLPAVGSRCWRDLVCPESGASVLNLAGDSSDADPMLELAYDEGGFEAGFNAPACGGCP